jgi:hypothetical protein
MCVIKDLNKFKIYEQKMFDKIINSVKNNTDRNSNVKIDIIEKEDDENEIKIVKKFAAAKKSAPLKPIHSYLNDSIETILDEEQFTNKINDVNNLNKFVSHKHARVVDIYDDDLNQLSSHKKMKKNLIIEKIKIPYSEYEKTMRNKNNFLRVKLVCREYNSEVHKIFNTFVNYFI